MKTRTTTLYHLKASENEVKKDFFIFPVTFCDFSSSHGKPLVKQ